MQYYKGMTWNVRGCNNVTNRRNIKTHLVENKINFLCLQETKCTSWDTRKRNSLWDEHRHGWSEAPATSLSGGLLTTWNYQYFTYLNHIITKNWILFKESTINTDQQFVCINIYAPQVTEDKEHIWQQLSPYIMTHEDIPLCIMSDFNSVRQEEDRVNYTHSRLDTDVFNSFITNNGLYTIKTQTPPLHLVWAGKKEEYTRLDLGEQVVV